MISAVNSYLREGQCAVGKGAGQGTRELIAYLEVRKVTDADEGVADVGSKLGMRSPALTGLQ